MSARLDDEVLQGERLLRVHEVLYVTGLSMPTLYRMMREQKFPRPVRLGPKSVAWPESEIDNFVRTRIAERKRGT